MLKKLLPFLAVAIALAAVFTILFATQRMGLIHPSLDRFTKKDEDVPVAETEPTVPEA